MTDVANCCKVQEALGFPGGSVVKDLLSMQEFDPWVRKIP